MFAAERVRTVFPAPWASAAPIYASTGSRKLAIGMSLASVRDRPHLLRPPEAVLCGLYPNFHSFTLAYTANRRSPFVSNRGREPRVSRSRLGRSSPSWQSVLTSPRGACSCYWRWSEA